MPLTFERWEAGGDAFCALRRAQPFIIFQSSNLVSEESSLLTSICLDGTAMSIHQTFGSLSPYSHYDQGGPASGDIKLAVEWMT